MEFLYFKVSDFDCQETGENEMDLEFIRKLDELRSACGWPFIVTSGYRSAQHSLEVKKERPGTHSFNGIGVAKTFVHVDTRTTTPVLWCY